MEIEIGQIIHYFSKIGVAVLEMTNGRIEKGDLIHIKGHTTELHQKVKSMQVDYKEIQAAEKGMQVGLKVELMVRPKDSVFKIKEETETSNSLKG